MFDHLGIVTEDLDRPTFWKAEHAPARNPIHLAFRAPYYCAYLFDIDGNNLEAGVYLEA